MAGREGLHRGGISAVRQARQHSSAPCVLCAKPDNTALLHLCCAPSQTTQLCAISAVRQARQHSSAPLVLCAKPDNTALRSLHIRKCFMRTRIAKVNTVFPVVFFNVIDLTTFAIMHYIEQTHQSPIVTEFMQY